METKKKRFYTLDLLRGTAVLFMLIAHAVYFFHARDNLFLVSLENLGNIFCFTTFLLVSGASVYLAYFREEFTLKTYRKVQNRALIFALTYFSLAFLLSFDSIISAQGFDKLKLIFDLLTLRNLPSFTEYFPPFIIYTLFIVIFPDFFKKLDSLAKVIFYSIIFYVIGFALGKVTVPDIILPWKALFFGAENYFRFPIFQYAPVLLFGFYIAHFFTNTEGIKPKIIFFRNSVFFLALLLLFFISMGLYLNLPMQTVFLRWPPNPAFLLLGLFLASVGGYVFLKTKQLKEERIIKDFLLLLGQNALSLFWIHIFILGIYEKFAGVRVSSIWLVLLMFIFLVLVSLALATFIPFKLKLRRAYDKRCEEDELMIEEESVIKLTNEVVAGSQKEYGILKKFFFPKSTGKNKRIIKKRHLLFGLLVSAVVGVFAYPMVSEEIIQKDKNLNLPWFNEEFGYRKQIEVENNDSLRNINIGDGVSIQFNHSFMVGNKESEKNGDDITLVYWNGEKYQKLSYRLLNSWNSTETSIIFEVPATVRTGRSDNGYFIYWGNANIVPRVSTQVGDFNGKYNVSLAEKEQYPFLLKQSKKWILLDGKEEDAVATLTLSLAKTTNETKANYKVLGTSIKGDFASNGDGTFETRVNLSTLKPGQYQIQAEITDGQYKNLSQKSTFYVSNPLYVAWTIDWEAMAINSIYLDALLSLSDKYKLPLTHYFNPRIYTTSTMSKERAQYLTNLIKDRRDENGEQIGLHLHMYYDFVESAGLVAKRDPNWGDAGDGYGAPNTNYTTEELEVLINHAIKLFEQNGLGRPDYYRAGGWFANNVVLQALENLNFKVDSSGRTKYKFGKNNLDGFWDLQSTTQPYRPSKNDQNRTSLNNNYNLVEMPNNGADSYWFNEKEMIKRFDENYTSKFLTNKKVVTYLSHPEWFKDTEKAKMEAVLSYVSTYLYVDDAGPVIFATQEEVYDSLINH